MKQQNFSLLEYGRKKKQTKLDIFLAEMDAIIPWGLLTVLIDDFYPRAGKGRHPMPLEVMLRIYFLQQWYALSDPGAEDALYDI